MRKLYSICCNLACFLLTAFSISAYGQPYPSKPIHIIVPFTAGGLVDATARQLAARMSEGLGKPIIIENRASVGGIVATAEVAHAAPDGYTLLYTNDALALSPHMYKKVNFDVAKDFAPITQVLSVPLVFLVHPSVPVSDLKELAALAKREPDRLSSGSGGVGTAAHLGLEMFNLMAGVRITHIPYKGLGPAIADFLGGQIQVFMVSTSIAAQHAKSGKARILALASGKRAINLPDVPTTAEAGFPGLEFTTWMGLVGPAGLPQPIITRLHDAALVSLNDPANKQRFIDQGIETPGTTPDEFRRFISSEYAKFGKVVAAAGIKPE